MSRRFGGSAAADERVTLVGQTVCIALYACGYAVGLVAWRAAFRAEPPAALDALLSAGVVWLWLCPLGLWVAHAARGDGTLRWARLNASVAVVLTWGAALGLLLPLAPGADAPAQRATAVVVSAIGSYAALRLLDGVAVLHAAIGVAGAVVMGWSGWQALGLLTAVIHREHLAGRLGAVHADRLPLALALGSLAAGALITAALHLRAGSGAFARPVPGDPPAQHPAHDGFPELSAAQVAFLAQAGAGAEKMRLERQQRANDAERGRDAERAVAAAVVDLFGRGWSLQAGVFIEGERNGDTDILATGPSGRHYAIDVKSTACAVTYDPARRELALGYSTGRASPWLLEIARRQALALTRHGYEPVQPVLCFTRATIACRRVVDGVVVIASDDLLDWLEAADAQARASGWTRAASAPASGRPGRRRRRYRTVRARSASRRPGG